MPKIQISKYGTQSVKVADILGNDDAMHQIEEIAEARLAEQSEITALREKLAAAHAALQLPENADLVENIKLLKLGALKQYEKAMNNNARCQWEYRAAARDALAELRASLVNAQQVIPTADAFDAFNTAIGRLDATIAKLDL